MNKNFLINSQYNAPLSRQIQESYNKLITRVAAIDVHSRTIKNKEGTGGLVSVANIIAYQIGWGKLLLSWYAGGLHGVIPQMPGDGFSTWDYVGLAHHFYIKYAYDSGIQQQQEFFNMVIKIIAMTEGEYNTGNLEKIGVWPWCTLASGKQWPLCKWITVNTVSPYKRALILIRKSPV